MFGHNPNAFLHTHLLTLLKEDKLINTLKNAILLMLIFPLSIFFENKHVDDTFAANGAH